MAEEGNQPLGDQQVSGYVTEASPEEIPSRLPAPDVPAPDVDDTLATSPGDERVQRPRFKNRSRGWWLRALNDDQSPSAPTSAVPVAPATEVGSASPARQAPIARPASTVGISRRRRRRSLLAAVLAIILALIALSQILRGASTTGGPANAVPTPAPLNVTGGAPLNVRSIIGATVGLSQPREAVELRNGGFAVADEGNKRLAILDAAGHLVRSVRSGAAPLQSPFAIVLSAESLYLLDAARGAIDQYGTDGRFKREIVHNPGLLLDARGLATGPNGTLYVADPLTNSILTFTTDGKLRRQLHTQSGADPGQFNQPSDVAAGAGDIIYVLDNQNNRIEALHSSGAFIGQWTVPQSDTLHSVHVVALPDGRILASDPAGALLIYPLGNAPPIRQSLQLSGRGGGFIRPLGISLTSDGNVLVTDNLGNRLLRVARP